MVKSMTGYGKAEANLDTGKLSIEIRTLNGKNADISLKTQLIPKDKELLIRQKITQELQRGTIDVYVSFEANSADSVKSVNTEAVKAYYSKIIEIRKSLEGFSTGAVENNDMLNNILLSTILRFPDVMDGQKREIVNEENWPTVEAAFDSAIAEVNEYRSKEGIALYNDVTNRVATILALENEVEGYEVERIEAVKSKILKNLEELQQKPDQSRFEQEMVFYLEKMDINEEKVRLRQHCKYFIDTIDSEPYPGKKLGFIIQEMGREINTTGSKANHAGIQRTVVRMKEELEKVREQSMNIL